MSFNRKAEKERCAKYKSQSSHQRLASSNFDGTAPVAYNNCTL